jgi:hypothetical protein
MSTYTIEEGIPVPEKLKRAVPPKSPIRLALECLEPGQSFLMQTADEYDRARSAASYLPDRQFVSRKVAGEGWRMWRAS